MGQRDFCWEEKIDKLPCGRRSTSMRSIAVHTEVNKPDEACASSGSFYLWVYCGCLIRNALTCSYSDSGPNKSTRFTRADIRTV